MIQAGIRSPAEVIGLVLEEHGVPDFASVAEEAAKRLGVALRSVSRPQEPVVIQANREGVEWATVQLGKGKPKK